MEKKTEMFALVCHNTEEWSSVRLFTSFEDAQSAMKDEYENEFNEFINGGWDKEELEDTSDLNDDNATIGWGCLDSPYIWAIHTVEVE